MPASHPFEVFMPNLSDLLDYSAKYLEAEEVPPEVATLEISHADLYSLAEEIITRQTGTLDEEISTPDQMLAVITACTTAAFTIGVIAGASAEEDGVTVALSSEDFRNLAVNALRTGTLKFSLVESDD